jgi:WD40 repeat protein
MHHLAHTTQGHSDAVTCMCFSPSGSLLASGSEDKTVRLWSVLSGKLIAEFKGHFGLVMHVRFSPDSQQASVCERGGGRGGGWKVEEWWGFVGCPEWEAGGFLF